MRNPRIELKIAAACSFVLFLGAGTGEHVGVQIYCNSETTSVGILLGNVPLPTKACYGIWTDPDALEMHSHKLTGFADATGSDWRAELASIERHCAVHGQVVSGTVTVIDSSESKRGNSTSAIASGLRCVDKSNHSG